MQKGRMTSGHLSQGHGAIPPHNRGWGGGRGAGGWGGGRLVNEVYMCIQRYFACCIIFYSAKLYLFHKVTRTKKHHHLLPSGSEEREVLLFGSIQKGILQARH